MAKDRTSDDIFRGGRLMDLAKSARQAVLVAASQHAAAAAASAKLQLARIHVPVLQRA